jgi:hypothetical protein
MLSKSFVQIGGVGAAHLGKISVEDPVCPRMVGFVGMQSLCVSHFNHLNLQYLDGEAKV